MEASVFRIALLLLIGVTAAYADPPKKHRLPTVPPQHHQCLADECNRPNSPLVRVEFPLPTTVCTEMNPHGDPKIRRVFFERPRCRGIIAEAQWYGASGATCSFEERV